YWIDNGATSLWERWDLGARSRDHAFLGGAIGEWLALTSTSTVDDMREVWSLPGSRATLGPCETRPR
ncbi:hypothetical protein, partial [Micromonospora sp. ATA51]|uniref:alpha-L-rhamnosidase-related protein n=1 Tax=Micromonospora sp. ATA51 TaxID=2806098 RepID=UPI001A4EDD16